MKQDRKSFLVYFDLRRQTEMLTDEQMGKLFRAMLSYADDGETVEITDPRVEMAFRFVMVQIREDRIKYEEKCEQNRLNRLNNKK